VLLKNEADKTISHVPHLSCNI